MYRMTSTAAKRRNIERQMNGALLSIKYGVPLLLANQLINWFLDCCGVGMIV